MIRDFAAAWPLFTGNARRFLLSAALAGFAYSGVYFLLANLFLARLGYDETFIGVFIATGAASFALFSLPAGIAGRRWGPRPTMVGGYVFLILGLVLLGMAALISVGWRPVWLLSCCALREFGNSFYVVNANPFLMGATGVEERRFVFSARGAIVPLAGFLGALAGGLLPGWSATLMVREEADPITMLVPLLLGAVVLVPGFIALLTTTSDTVEEEGATGRVDADGVGPGKQADASCNRPTNPSSPAARQVLEDRIPFGPILAMVGVGLLYIAAMAASMSFFNLYMDQGLGVSTSRIGTVMALGQLLAAPAGLTLALLSARLGYHRTFALSAAGVAVGALLMGLVDHWLAASTGAVLITVLSAIAFPAITIYQQELVAPDWRPVMSGAYMMAVALGWTGMASGGGYLIADVGYRPLFLLGAAVTAVGVGWFALYARRVARRQRKVT